MPSLSSRAPAAPNGRRRARSTLTALRAAGAGTALCAVVLARPPAPLGAQAVVVDQGSFALIRDDRPVGREEFIIRRQAGADGPVLRAQATISAGALRLTPRLTATEAGAPLSYELEVRQDGEIIERLLGQRGRGRMTVRTTSGSRDAAREFLAGDDAAIVDGDIVHQHWFLVRRPVGQTTRVIAPRTGGRMTVRSREIGPESVRIGGTVLSATRLALEGFPDGVREVWIDVEGRLLRLTVPATGFQAIRQEPPD